ncbi:DUF4190 domain-containing protein [Oerskovia sp. Sa1BUA8]|uniref:DUF4190 domain-containing protein n=1 Tax=Oerskovia douganii TaxID=2762210 RepID=A0A9D5Z0U3_9CELL|nr:DUF4190 domain-containing protein [Oerskovia douganii]MBE7701861.1 DUF4190 domain-containing protein [Oerskovia douganii]
MTSSPPPGSGTPDPDPLPPQPHPPASGGPGRQPPLVPYRPPAWADDAPVAADPYAPAPVGDPTAPPAPGGQGYGPYGPPGTPVYGTPPGAYEPSPYGGQHPSHPGPPNGYGTGYGPPPGLPVAPSWNASFAPPPRQNGLALASMITSLAGIAFCLVPGVVGLVLGIVALQQISRDGTTGRGFAITGVTVGAVSTLFIALWFLTIWSTYP